MQLGTSFLVWTFANDRISLMAPGLLISVIFLVLEAYCVSRSVVLHRIRFVALINFLKPNSLPFWPFGPFNAFVHLAGNRLLEYAFIKRNRFWFSRRSYSESWNRLARVLLFLSRITFRLVRIIPLWREICLKNPTKHAQVFMVSRRI